MQHQVEPIEGAAARGLLSEYAAELHRRWSATPLPDPHPEPPTAGLAPPTGVSLIARVDADPAACAGLRASDPDTGEISAGSYARATAASGWPDHS